MYYMYQSEWTTKDVLHIFPHWNWETGKTVDVWAYYNNADEVELYLNGQSLENAVKPATICMLCGGFPILESHSKPFRAKTGKRFLVKEIKTAGTPVGIRLIADRLSINADCKDLSFVTVELLDKDGNASPVANQLVRFSLEGEGSIAGTDNGDQNDPVSLRKTRTSFYLWQMSGHRTKYFQSRKYYSKLRSTGCRPSRSPWLVNKIG